MTWSSSEPSCRAVYSIHEVACAVSLNKSQLTEMLKFHEHAVLLLGKADLAEQI